MNINHICLNNKFGAKVVGELKKEISNKKKKPCKILGALDSNFYNFDNVQPINIAALKEINTLADGAKADIFHNNNSKYIIKIDGYEHVLFFDRGDDKKSTTYPNLRKALKDIEKKYLN